MVTEKIFKIIQDFYTNLYKDYFEQPKILYTSMIEMKFELFV